MANSTRYYHYDPSLPAAAIFALLFLATTVFHIYQTTATKTWFFVPFCIGGVFETVGFAARAVNAHQTPNWTLVIFVIQSMGILLAPALLAASIYMEFGLLVDLTEGEKYSIVRRSLITKIFVTGDVLSFLFQAIGGSILAKQNPSSANLGKAIIEVGLFFQIIFFGLFLVNAINFSIKLRKQLTANRRSMPWQKHMMTLFTVGILIFVRCIYRVIEYMQGPQGNLMIHEIYIYILDAGLILIAMVIFHLYHPSEISSLLRGGKVAVLFRVENIVHKYSGLQLNTASSDVNLNRDV